MPAEKSELSAARRALYFSTNLFMSGLIGAICLLPYRWRVPFMGWLARMLAPLVGHTARIRSNLALVCPDLPEREVRRICRDVPDTAGRAIIEHFSPHDFSARAARAPITGPGLSAFEDARAEGRPVMFITGHFGNYTAARAALSARGHVIGALYRRMANPYFNEIYARAFLATGDPMFEQGRAGFREMVRTLKNGGIIAILTDLHAIGGERLSFFGKPALTSINNMELALRYNALVLPVYGIRQPNGLDFEIAIHAPILHSDPVTMTQALNDDLESMVRAHMGQWFWVHRRWKAATAP